MIEYDKHKPLISLHVPKMAGTSYRMALSNTFGQGLLLHYNKNIQMNGKLLLRYPERYIWRTMMDMCSVLPICVHGHFRNSEGTAASDYYPEAAQFSILLRDPLEAVVSNYRYQKKIIKEGQIRNFPFSSVNDYLQKQNCLLPNHTPKAMFSDPVMFFEEKCVIVGCLDHMNIFASDYERVFGKHLDIPHVNATERSHEEEVDEDVASEWKRRNSASYTVYEAAVSLTNFRVRKAALRTHPDV